MGPSSRRITVARGTSFGFLAKKYPPPLPFLLSRILAFFNSSRIFSRNFRGIFFFFAISAMSTGSSFSCSARYISAWKAYWVFLESISYISLLLLESKYVAHLISPLFSPEEFGGQYCPDRESAAVVRGMGDLDRIDG